MPLLGQLMKHACNHRKNWALNSFYSVAGCCCVWKPIKLIGLHSREKQLQYKWNGKCISLIFKEVYLGLKSIGSNNIYNLNNDDTVKRMIDKGENNLTKGHYQLVAIWISSVPVHYSTQAIRMY